MYAKEISIHMLTDMIAEMCQWQIKDFSGKGVHQLYYVAKFLPKAENCIKMNENGPRGEHDPRTPLGSVNLCGPLLWRSKGSVRVSPT